MALFKIRFYSGFMIQLMQIMMQMYTNNKEQHNLASSDPCLDPSLISWDWNTKSLINLGSPRVQQPQWPQQPTSYFLSPPCWCNSEQTSLWCVCGPWRSPPTGPRRARAKRRFLWKWGLYIFRAFILERNMRVLCKRNISTSSTGWQCSLRQSSSDISMALTTTEWPTASLDYGI